MFKKILIANDGSEGAAQGAQPPGRGALKAVAVKWRARTNVDGESLNVPA